MNPYQYNQQWKFILLIFAAIIGIASLGYTNYLIKNLSVAERTKAEVWAMSTRNIFNMPDINDEFTTYIYAVRDKLSIPAIITDSRDSIIYWKGLDSTKTNINISSDLVLEDDQELKYDPSYFKKQLSIMKSQHQPVVVDLYSGDQWFIYYKDSTLLSQLRVFPYIQLSLIAVFLFIAYTVFNSIRKSEQNQVWVGMAKETAHQLGTPISSLMAWLELIKSKFNADDDPLIQEMEQDIKRLEIVADRFSKIGSKPILEPHNIYNVISTFVNYFKIRISDKIKFSVSGDKHLEALINIPLFDWVLENILKNAANAISTEGNINIRITENLAKEQIYIDISDTGKGIPKSKFDAVFQPGYTTRKRGWGLGLSLTKRIVENYHQGEIFIKESEIDKGTTVRIVLKSSLTYEPTSI
jgi:signal transduction histidine kinase